MWGPDTPWIEPVVGAAAMAGATSTIRFYTSVIKLAVRHPVLVAKQIASLDAMSNGRFGLGAGLGWLPEEFEWCGADFDSRGKRMNEALEILRLIWGGGMVEYHGEHYQFEKLQMSPAPEKPIPIYLGGHTKPGLRRAAKYGDGWSSAMLPKKKLLPIIAQLNEYREAAGRADLPFEIQAVVTDVFTPDGFRELEGEGVTDIICVPWMFHGQPMQGGDVDKKIEALEKFYEQVVKPTNAG
jgi:probable F420-dependent oxidoreductase